MDVTDPRNTTLWVVRLVLAVVVGLAMFLLPAGLMPWVAYTVAFVLVWDVSDWLVVHRTGVKFLVVVLRLVAVVVVGAVIVPLVYAGASDVFTMVVALAAVSWLPELLVSMLSPNTPAHQYATLAPATTR